MSSTTTIASQNAKIAELEAQLARTRSPARSKALRLSLASHRAHRSRLINAERNRLAEVKQAAKTQAKANVGVMRIGIGAAMGRVLRDEDAAVVRVCQAALPTATAVANERAARQGDKIADAIGKQLKEKGLVMVLKEDLDKLQIIKGLSTAILEQARKKYGVNGKDKKFFCPYYIALDKVLSKTG